MENLFSEVRVMRALHLLHAHDYWGEELLDEGLFKHKLRLLKPKWFFILEEKVKGTSEGEIAKLLGWTQKSVMEETSRIKGVFRDGFRKEIDARLSSYLFKFKQYRRY